MVFRRDNKVDSFQRQMNALRDQLGSTGEVDDALEEMPDLKSDQYPEGAYRGQDPGSDQDAGAYSFGTYPADAGQGLAPADIEDEMPVVPDLPAVDESVSVIARDTTWKGDIDAENSLQVFGRFEGTIRVREDVWIIEGAEVDATINAQRVIVGGSVSGTINASNRFEALPKGQVNADVTTPVSVVHEGAIINGNFRVGGNEGGSDSRDRAATPSVIQRRSRTGS